MLTDKKLDELLAKHDAKIDGYRHGAGKFRDLEIGVGKPLDKLQALLHDIKATDTQLLISIEMVTNEDHPDYRKPMIGIKSYWWDRKE